MIQVLEVQMWDDSDIGIFVDGVVVGVIWGDYKDTPLRIDRQFFQRLGHAIGQSFVVKSYKISECEWQDWVALASDGEVPEYPYDWDWNVVESLINEEDRWCEVFEAAKEV